MQVELQYVYFPWASFLGIYVYFSGPASINFQKSEVSPHHGIFDAKVLLQLVEVSDILVDHLQHSENGPKGGGKGLWIHPTKATALKRRAGFFCRNFCSAEMLSFFLICIYNSNS